MEAAPKESGVLEFTKTHDRELHQGVGNSLADLGHKDVSTEPENQKPIQMGGLNDVTQYIGDSWEESTSGEGLLIGNRVTKSRNPIRLAAERLKRMMGKQKAA